MCAACAMNWQRKCIELQADRRRIAPAIIRIRHAYVRIVNVCARIYDRYVVPAKAGI